MQVLEKKLNMLVYVNVFATYAHTYISKYIVLDALVSMYLPICTPTVCN